MGEVLVKLIDHERMTQLRNHTGWRRLRLRDYETFTGFEIKDDRVNLIIETYDVKETAREDRFNKHGFRMIVLQPVDGRWHVTFDVTSWDDDFVPFVHARWGRSVSPEEFEEQREWEKLCYRPGTKSTPLDSYDRILDPFCRSTDKMERHF